MIGTVLLAITLVAEEAAIIAPCLPVASGPSRPTPSAIEDHRALRKAIGEPMPQSRTTVMLYGKGGHLATEEYSIVLVRADDGAWLGTAVGRSQAWIKDAPYSPMKRAEWVLDRAAGRQLDDAISNRCPLEKSAAKSLDSGPPPRGLVAERIDVLTPGHTPSTFFSEEGEDKITALIRPPR